MFIGTRVKSFENKIWLSFLTMHGDELRYITEAHGTNWMSTVGRNINEVEHPIAAYIGCRHAVALSSGTLLLHLSMKLAGMEAHGVQAVDHGTLEGHRVF